jgi:hypothetical protein
VARSRAAKCDRSCYYEEFSIEIEEGQAAEKAITLDKLLEY